GIPYLGGGLIQRQRGIHHVGRLQLSSQRHGQRRLTTAPYRPASSARASASAGVKAALTERGPSVCTTFEVVSSRVARWARMSPYRLRLRSLTSTSDCPPPCRLAIARKRSLA